MARNLNIDLAVSYHRRVWLAEQMVERRRKELEAALDRMQLTGDEMAEYVRRTTEAQ